MNLTHRLVQVTFLAAVAAAGFTVKAADAAEKPMRIIELPRVTVVARRLPPQIATASSEKAVRIIELPRVVVVAQRSTPSGTFVAQRTTRPAQM